MTSLAARLEARIAKLLTLAEGQPKRVDLSLVVTEFPDLGARVFAYENAPIDGMVADALAARARDEIERYASATCGAEVLAEVLEHDELAALWPLDTSIAPSPECDAAGAALHRLALLDRGRWPLAVAPLAVAETLERIGDSDAGLVASMIREGRIIYRGAPGFESEGQRRVSGLALERRLFADFEMLKFAPHDSSGKAIWDNTTEAGAQLRWSPLAVAIVLHVEQLVLEPGALYASRRARKRVRECYGDKLPKFVRDALAAGERNDDDAGEELERATRKALTRFAERLDADPGTDAEALAERDGVLELDARFAEFLEATCGAPGKANAKHVLDVGSERLAAYQRDRNAAALWAPWDGARPAMLAIALWESSVRDAVELARRKPPALVRAVHTSALEFHSRIPKFDPDSRTLSFDGRKLAELYGASFDLGVIERGLSLLGSVAAHRLLRWEVITGHERAIRGDPYANILEVDGGWTALARSLGLDPHKPKVIPNLRAIVHAQAHFRFAFPDGSHGNMLSYTEKGAEGRNTRARVTISLGAPLLPGYVHGLTGAERKLVPLLREPPPLYGRPNEHGQQMTMSLAVMAELRERARELATNGGVQLTHDDWTRLADRSGVPRRLALHVVEYWLAGDTRAVPFLKQPDRDTYTLGDAHAQERNFLEEAGRAEVQASRAGQKGVAKRKAKLARAAGRGKA